LIQGTELKSLGSNQLVTWPALQPYPDDHDGEIVELVVDIADNHDSSKRGWYRVARSGQSWNLKRVGAWLIPTVRFPFPGYSFAGLSSLSQGTKLFCLTGDDVTGPWTVARSGHHRFLKAASEDGTVWLLSTDHLDDDTILKLDDERYWLAPDVSVGTPMSPTDFVAPEVITPPSQTEIRARQLNDSRATPALAESTRVESFAQNTLWPSLARWVPKAGPKSARALHCGVLGCPLLLAPGAEWSTAYQGAMGNEASELHVLTVSPTWLTLEDAWRAGLERAWTNAQDNPERLVLVHFQDFDRSLVQCWAMPLINLNAGLCGQIASPSVSGWPANLRTVWSRAGDSAVLPLPAELRGSWGAVTGRLSERGHRPTNVQGTKLSWSEARIPDPVASATDPLALGLGLFAQCASRDLHRLAQAARQLSEPERLAELIRLEWPQELWPDAGA